MAVVPEDSLQRSSFRRVLLPLSRKRSTRNEADPGNRRLKKGADGLHRFLLHQDDVLTWRLRAEAAEKRL